MIPGAVNVSSYLSQGHYCIIFNNQCSISDRRFHCLSGKFHQIYTIREIEKALIWCHLSISSFQTGSQPLSYQRKFSIMPFSKKNHVCTIFFKLLGENMKVFFFFFHSNYWLFILFCLVIANIRNVFKYDFHGMWLILLKQLP